MRAAAALAVAAFLIAPISLTLVAARQAGLELPELGSLPRFAVPFEKSTAPAKLALKANPPAVDVQRAVGSGTGMASGAGTATDTLTGGNLGSNGPVIPEQPLTEILAGGSLAATPDDAKAGASALIQEGSESDTVAKSSAWPLKPAAQRAADPRLRDRYLWRAWLENATEFHAQRSGGKSLTVYQPGEGYAVLAAAYQPMIQPVDPRDRAPEGRSIYQDRRERGAAPGEEEQESEAAEATERAAQKAKANRVTGSAGGFASSFQPWDSDIVGDPFGPANSLVSKVPGLRIEQVVLFQGFSSNGYPMEQRSLPLVNPNLGYDIDIGALATVTWSHARRTGGFFLSYTPSHIRRKNFSEWNSTDHQLAIGAVKRYARWNISLDSNNAVRGLQQVLFTPAVLRPVANAPQSFEDLVASVQGGQLTNEEIASVLTGAPVVDSRSKTDFDLARVWSSSLGASASYAHSARISSYVGVNGSHYRALSNPASDDSISGLQGLYRSTSLSGNAGVNYKLSPETSVGVGSSVSRNYSSYRDSTSVNTTASVSRRLGRNWSVNGGAGVGQVQVAPLAGIVQGQGATPAAADPFARSVTTWIVNGGVNYGGRSHSFGVTASRTAGDSVGLGATNSQQATAQWSWARPNSHWAIQGQASVYQMSVDPYIGDVRGGFAGLGLVRRLSRETAIQANYSYQSFQSPFRGVVSNLSGHRVQMSWVWRPTGPPR
jgi:hypothetical protein